MGWEESGLERRRGYEGFVRNVFVDSARVLVCVVVGEAFGWEDGGR